MNLATAISLVLAGSALEGFAQVCLKLASSRQSGAYVFWTGFGSILFVLEIGLYTRALKSLDIAVAYPLSALSYAAVVIAARMLLGEKVALRRWLGVAFIVAGAALAIPE
jgi:undecaprenyl phosphate-alpha-L-ara4N flippase subunit ArnE